MSKLAAEHNAINISQGFPDFDADPVLVELVAEAMRSGYNQYAPMPGSLVLRDAIANKLYSADRLRKSCNLNNYFKLLNICH